MIQDLFWLAASKGLVALPALATTTAPTSSTVPGNTSSTVPGASGTSITLFDPLKGQTLGGLLATILATLTWLAVPVVSIMIIIGAYYIITSGGNPGRRTTGKNYVLWAAVGFAILLLSSSVVAILTDFLSR